MREGLPLVAGLAIHILENFILSLVSAHLLRRLRSILISVPVSERAEAEDTVRCFASLVFGLSCGSLL